MSCLFQGEPIPIIQNHWGVTDLGHAWCVHNLNNNHSSAHWQEWAMFCFLWTVWIKEMNRQKWTHETNMIKSQCQILICQNFTFGNLMNHVIVYVYMSAKWKIINTLGTKIKICAQTKCMMTALPKQNISTEIYGVASTDLVQTFAACYHWKTKQFQQLPTSTFHVYYVISFSDLCRKHMRITVMM